MQSKNQVMEERLPVLEEENKPLGFLEHAERLPATNTCLASSLFCTARKLIRRINLLEKVAQNEQVFTSKLSVPWPHMRYPC